MLRHARMAAMRKLRRSVVWNGQSPVRAVHVGRGEIVWQDRCDANGSKEPDADVAEFDNIANASPQFDSETANDKIL
jgi:hypothetical protein